MGIEETALREAEKLLEDLDTWGGEEMISKPLHVKESFFKTHIVPHLLSDDEETVTKVKEVWRLIVTRNDTFMGGMMQEVFIVNDEDEIQVVVPPIMDSEIALDENGNICNSYEYARQQDMASPFIHAVETLFESTGIKTSSKHKEGWVKALSLYAPIKEGETTTKEVVEDEEYEL